MAAVTINTVIIGGGLASLAMSYHLTQLRREHVILEAKRTAERWRTQRWDSLTFQFPNWSMQLPDYSYRGNEPEGFAPRDEVVRFIEDYAEFIQAPVCCGLQVFSLKQIHGCRPAFAHVREATPAAPRRGHRAQSAGVQKECRRSRSRLLLR